MLFKDIIDTYLDKDPCDLSHNQLVELSDSLKSIQPCHLKNIDDHKTYLLLLRKYRVAVLEGAKLMGANFIDTIKSLLSVGADGLYASETRFLFELIQNVDDCDYDDINNCNLDIHFDFNNGILSFEYNEKGFRPIDVFSITGIAEASKNISPDKVEIGEKGIGFKSVFGVADKVIIQSGMFSFSISQENFTIPNIEYNNFSPVSGTRITLFMKSKVVEKQGQDHNKTIKLSPGEVCKGLFESLAKKYSEKGALFTQNPILFLNKLSRIKMYFDGFDSLEFSVKSGTTIESISNDECVEHGVVISSTVSARHYKDKTITSISCSRYSKNVEYSRETCESRYGIHTAFPY